MLFVARCVRGIAALFAVVLFCQPAAAGLADSQWRFGFAGVALSAVAAAALVAGFAIGRRRNAASELQQFTREFEAFLNHTSDFIYFKDADSRLIFCSQPLADVTGHADWRDLLGKHDRDIFPPELAQIYEQEEHAVLGEGRPLINKINPYHDVDGQVRYVLTNKWPRFDDQGRVIGLFGISVDITERRRIEKRLAESEQKYRRLFETMTSGVIYQDADGKIVSANPAAERILGLSFDQMIGKTSMDPRWQMIDPDGSEVKGIDHPVMIALRSGNPVGPVVRGVFDPKRNDHVWLSITAIPLFQPGECEPYQSYGLFDDVTERFRAEARLRDAANVFDHAYEGILITDSKGVILDVNAAFSRITGYESEEVLGRNPRLLSSGRHDAAFYEQMWQALTERGQWVGEIWNRRKNGEVYAQLVTISAVRSPEGQTQRYVALFSDITTRVEHQQQLEHMARHDALTGLPNRFSLETYLEQALRVARRDHKRLAMLFIDLDRFKQVNDTLGHHVGDLLLMEVAERLRDCVRASDIVARFGGDEFVVFLSEIDDPQDAAGVAGKILQKLGQPYLLEGQSVESSPSVGISLYPDDGGTGDVLVRAADRAMYAAKDRGRNNFQFFSKKQ